MANAAKTIPYPYGRQLATLQAKILAAKRPRCLSHLIEILMFSAPERECRAARPRWTAPWLIRSMPREEHNRCPPNIPFI